MPRGIALEVAGLAQVEVPEEVGVDEVAIEEFGQHLAMAAGLAVASGASAFGMGAEIAAFGIAIGEFGYSVLIAVVVAVVEGGHSNSPCLRVQSSGWSSWVMSMERQRAR